MTLPVFGDRVQETFTTTGTGTLSLAGAVAGYQAFSSVVPNSGTCYYGATDGSNWEVGLGTYSSSGDVLARTTILSSSNGGSAVSWLAGTKSIWLDLPAAAVNPTPIIGPTRNASMSVTSASASATFSADGVVVATSLSGRFNFLPSYSQSITLTGTGAGGMDTGSAPTSGFVSLYAISGVSGTSILACSASTSNGSVYSGSNMPSGYTYSGLLGIWPTNGSGLFPIAIQRDRSVFFSPATAVSGGSSSGYTNVSISSIVPPGAVGFWGNMGCNTTGGTVSIAGDTNDTGRQTGEFIANVQMPYAEVPIITSQQFDYKVSSGAATITISAYRF